MTGELGGSQLSSLLEAVPGLASVLRSPVADAMVNMIRAGAGLGQFQIDDARELVQYATRRGLIPSAEGTQLMEEVEGIAGAKRGGGKPKAKPQKGAATSAPRASAPAKAKKAVKKPARSKTATKAASKAAKKTSATPKKSVKKAARPATKAAKKSKRR